jgi:enamine deaminase RidA (YjgF/YER057c/UK114 family)
MKKAFGLAALAGISVLGATGYAADITRLPMASKFPISRAVTVPAGYQIYFISGTTAAADSMGDTKTQTVSVFEQMKGTLKELGLTFKDVVKMNVFLVADPKMGKMDFTGFMAGYTQYFATPDEPNVPARSAVQVAGLAGPGALVEIEVEAAKKVGK